MAHGQVERPPLEHQGQKSDAASILMSAERQIAEGGYDMTWFEVAPEDETETVSSELAFVAALRAHERSGGLPTESSETIIRSNLDGSHTQLIAFVSLIDEGGPDEWGVVLMDAGVHLFGNRVQGDRLDSQGFTAA